MGTVERLGTRGGCSTPQGATVWRRRSPDRQMASPQGLRTTYDLNACYASKPALSCEPSSNGPHPLCRSPINMSACHSVKHASDRPKAKQREAMRGNAKPGVSARGSAKQREITQNKLCKAKQCKTKQNESRQTAEQSQIECSIANPKRDIKNQ